MPRTLIGEEQVRDEDFHSEEEFSINFPHSLIDATAHIDVDGTALSGHALIYDSTTGLWIPGIVSTSTEHVEYARRFFLGHLMSYPNKGSVASTSDVQYTRVWINEGIVIESGETFCVNAHNGDQLRIGLYNQLTPTSLIEDPYQKLAETSIYTFTGSDDNSFININFVSPYAISVSGYYWIAIIINDTRTTFAVSDTFRSEFLPRREESSTGVTLPSTAGSLSNPTAACAYAAVIRQGT